MITVAPVTVTVTQLTQYSDTPFEIFTIDNLYTDTELQTFIDYIENADVTNKRFTNSDFKNGKIVHAEWSKLMYERLMDHLPPQYVDKNGVQWEFVKCPHIIMYAKIASGEKFSIHTDTGYAYDDATSEYSKFTFFTYLNDGFDGGNTQFYDDYFNRTSTINPSRNKTLFFDIDLFHSGESVTKGCKMWIGSELVCRKIAK